MSVDFEEFWKRLMRDLGTSQRIRNWTVKKGYIGEDFKAMWKGGNYIKCYPPSAGVQNIPKWDFEFMYEHWDAYLNERVRRHWLRDQSRFTKYTISIIHQFEHLRKN